MKTDNDPRTTEELRAEMIRLFREYLGYIQESIGDRIVSMTDATEAIYGTSGRGNPRAVRIIETLGEYGLVLIRANGRGRKVQISSKGLELLNNEGATI